MNIYARARDVFRRHKKQIFVSVIALTVLGLVAIIGNYVFIGRYVSYIKGVNELPNSDGLTGVVLGGGIKDGKPLLQLRGRLDAAAELLDSGKVSKLIVSGDNRFESYDEPGVMRDYLVNEKGVDPTKIQEDYAGRSTYETCERATKVFGLKQAVFISESTHLPRVLYTCRHFDIDAYGYSSDDQTDLGFMLGQRWREVLARTKASVNLYIVGEKTVLGEKINL